MADQIPESTKSRAAFALAASKIDRDARLSDLTDAEIDALIASTRAAPPAMDREAVAKAIGDADAAFGYSCNLTRLVDGIATYTLTMAGYEPAEFDSIDDAHLVIAERRNAARADAIPSTLSADAIRQGEGVYEGDAIRGMVRLAVWNAAKKKGISDEAGMATVEAVIAELPATPASHASDGGK